MPTFTVNLVTRPAISAAGLKVRTTMTRAMADCSALWERGFGPRMAAFPVAPEYAGLSFGACVMVDAEAFDYWAAMALAAGAAAPEGMDVLTLPAGKYAECAVGSLAELSSAYEYVCSTWAAGQEKFSLDTRGCSVEVYGPAFQKSGELTIYCPLVEK